MLNPFKNEFHGGYAVDVQSRLDCVRQFDLVECRAALKLPDLQKTVRVAVERRIRKLHKPEYRNYTRPRIRNRRK